MALSTKPYKGARDFYPEDERLQKYLFNVMRTVCERYGYEEYDAPVLEPTELYLQKGNQEIIEQQTYTFTDRGERSVTLRTEMTPSVARMVAGRRQELSYPLRWYSIPQCWRYERMQRGRGREFYQLNVDIFGEDSIVAEHELILLVRDLLAGYGANDDTYTIHVNSRACMDWLFSEKLGLAQDEKQELFRLIDRMHKLDEATFNEQLTAALAGQEQSEAAAELLRSFLASKSIEALPDEIQGHSTLAELRELLDLCLRSGVANIVFDPTITRGFEYYTNIVFEVFDTHPENNRSMFGGGRYDNLLEAFGAEPIPTAGFGMGDLTLQNFLELHDLLPEPKPETDFYAVCVGDVYSQATEAVAQLRSKGCRVALDATGRKLDKSIKAADKKRIPYVLFIGKDEVESQRFTVRELSSGHEEARTIDEIAALSDSV